VAELIAPKRTRCVTHRGSFTIPAALFEDGREHDLARYFAQRMPDRAKSAGRSMPLPNGDVIVRWRIIDVVPA
jgi:hypothetical protein